MNEIDEGRGKKYIVGNSGEGGENILGSVLNQTGLEQVPETMEWSEYTPTGNHKNPNFTQAVEEQKV